MSRNEGEGKSTSSHLGSRPGAPSSTPSSSQSSTQSSEPIELTTAVDRLEVLGPREAKLLKELGLTNLGKLLAHLPMRHELLEAEAPIAELIVGQIVSARGEVTATRLAGRMPKQRFEAVLMDATGRLDLVFFNMGFMREKVRPGVRIRVQGKAADFHGGLQIVNPKVWVIAPSAGVSHAESREQGPDLGPEDVERGSPSRASIGEVVGQPAVEPDARADAKARSKRQAEIVAPTIATAPVLPTGTPNIDEPNLLDERLRPVYPASEDVPSRVIERAMVKVLALGLPLIVDHFDASFRMAHALPELREAYRMQHAPADMEEVKSSRRRLAYDELFLLQLGVQLRRAHLRERLKAPALKFNPGVDRAIRQRLPFSFTPGQETVVAEIAKDLSGSVPTNRLIQGDVGSGKTAVALYASLMAVASGHQAALMAPTELLAEQHAASMGRMLEGSRVRVALLTGSLPKAEREPIIAALRRGEIDLLIGTHALITDSVEFASLAVAIIDEQHRFGVHQRATLRGNASDARTTPHVLVMTATPIPRSIAMTLLGDLDVSTIRGLPPGRVPITTKVVEATGRDEAYRWLKRRVEAGDQAYIVVPAIGLEEGVEEGTPLFSPEEGSQKAGNPAPALRTVAAITTELEGGHLAGCRVATLHGRMSRPTREATMDRFRRGEIDVLIATTVIEVGVDVPNATVMVVEQADRFGLAQLHQLRGRVGRGSKPSWCLLLTDEPTEMGRARLTVMATITDGFLLAEKDFELRGPGEIVGSKQSGLPPFKVADLAKDIDLLMLARHDAAELVRMSPNLARPSDALLRRRLLKAFGTSLGLADVG